MGKQKSFIIVGSTFAGIIILILLFALLTKGIKKTKFEFESSIYTLEVGKKQSLGPSIYAGGDVKKVEELVLEYSAENNDIVDVQQGAYSSGSIEVYCWGFKEVNADGETVVKESRIPYDENDVISIVDGKWYVNNVNTFVNAEKEYTEDEIKTISGKTEKLVAAKCYIFNGVQSTIRYFDDDIVERNEATGNWVINGKDTGYTYKGIYVTIVGKKNGETTLTVSGKIKGKTISTKTTINVINPNPNSLKVNYIDETIFVSVNKEFKVDDYKVLAANDSVAEPLQAITYSFVGNSDGIQNNNNVFKATKEGTYRIKLAVPKSSFDKRLGQEKSITLTVKVIAIEADEEGVKKVELARKNIANLGDVTDTEECRALVAQVRSDVNVALEAIGVDISNENEVKKYITNIEALEYAESILSTESNN